MLRYLLLLANPAQLFPVNPGKAEQTSRSVIVLGTDHEHDDGRGRIRSFSRRTMKDGLHQGEAKTDINSRR